MKKIVPTAIVAAAVAYYVYNKYGKRDENGELTELKLDDEKIDEIKEKVNRLKEDVKDTVNEIKDKLAEDGDKEINPIDPEDDLKSEEVFAMEPEEEVEIRPEFLKEIEDKAKNESQRKLLDLQADLQMAGYDEGNFLLIQNIQYSSEEALVKLVNMMKEEGFEINESEYNCISVSKIIGGKDNIKPTIMFLFDRVANDRETYVNFKVKMV